MLKRITKYNYIKQRAILSLYRPIRNQHCASLSCAFVTVRMRTSWSRREHLAHQQASVLI